MPEDITAEWTKITGITFVMLVLASVIRHFKPLYTRYPLSFSFTPVVILIFYPFITDADVLKNLLNQLLQGGAILISFLLYLTLGNKLRSHFIFLAGILLFILAYGLYWFGNDLTSLNPWAWQLFMAAGVITMSQSTIEISRANN